jgi:hypothetical protein
MRVRLLLLAHGRSGDKGDSANVGVIARREQWYGFLARELTAGRVAEHLKSLAKGPVERFELPNLGALNFIVHRALGGGGTVSLKFDAQGKTFAQAVFRMSVEIPEDLAADVREHWNGQFPPDCVLDDASTSTSSNR